MSERIYEFNIIDMRRCLEMTCSEIFNDPKLSDMSYKIIDDAVEDFLYEHELRINNEFITKEEFNNY